MKCWAFRCVAAAGLTASACAPAGPPSPQDPQTEPSAPLARRGESGSVRRAVGPASAKAEHDARGSGKADPSLSRGGVRWDRAAGRIQFERPIFSSPSRLALTVSEREQLDQVAALLQAEQDIQLLRVEVYGSAGDAKPEEIRALYDRAQARADLIFKYLWKQGNVWAERLEAIGYITSEPLGAKTPWRVVFRVLQTRAKVDPKR